MISRQLITRSELNHRLTSLLANKLATLHGSKVHLDAFDIDARPHDTGLFRIPASINTGEHARRALESYHSRGLLADSLALKQCSTASTPPIRHLTANELTSNVQRYSWDISMGPPPVLRARPRINRPTGSAGLNLGLRAKTSAAQIAPIPTGRIP